MTTVATIMIIWHYNTIRQGYHLLNRYIVLNTRIALQYGFVMSYKDNSTKYERIV